MKTLHLIFIVLGLGALTVGWGFAAEASRQSRDAAASQSRNEMSNDWPTEAAPGVAARVDQTGVDGADVKVKRETNRAVGANSPTKAKRIMPIPLPSTQKPVGKDMGQSALPHLAPIGLNNSSGVVKKGVPAKSMARAGSPKVPSAVFRPSAPTVLPVAKHTAPSLMFIGVPRPSTTKSAALTGTGMKPRP
jgi:hypothetical protein